MCRWWLSGGAGGATLRQVAVKAFDDVIISVIFGARLDVINNKVF